MMRGVRWASLVFIAAACATAAGPEQVPRPPAVVEPSAGVDPAAAVDLAATALPDEVEYDGGFAKLTFAQAVKLSKEQGKNLVLYVYTVWCGPCKELDQKVFPDPVFQEYARSLVAIKVDAGTEEGAAVGKLFGVSSYPTTVVCEPGGKEIERFYSYHPTAEYVQTIRDYTQHLRTATWYREQAEAHPEDLALSFTAGRELAIRTRGAEAIPFLQRVIEAGEGKGVDNEIPNALLLLGKTVYLDEMKDYDKALPVLEELSARYPTTFHGVEATYMIARIWLERRDEAKAKEVLLGRVKLNEADAISYFRFGSFCLQHGFLLPEAIAKLEEGVAKHPSEAYLWKTLADLEFRVQRYEDAVAAMRRAVELEPATEAYGKLLETYENALKRSQEGQP